MKQLRATMERMKQRQERRRAEMTARIRSKSRSPSINKLPKGENPGMSYKLHTTMRRFQPLFGLAYPWLKPIELYDKRAMLYKLLSDAGVGQPRISIDMNKSLFGMQMEISVDQDGKRGYDSAEAIEKYIRNLPRLRTLSPPRWYFRMLPGRLPTDSFMVNDVNHGEMFAWLAEHCKPTDYQFYTKYGEDRSIGFRNGEHGAMFKLTFAEKDI